MKVFSSIDNLPEHLRRGVVSIGNFDGVHRGHQALIGRVCALKGKRPGGVLSFSPHPASFLNPQLEHFNLCSDAQKAQLVRALGGDFIIMHELSADFLRMSPQEFIAQVLVDKLACQDLVVGDDFSFGAQAQGGVADLALSAASGAFRLHVIEAQHIEGERCSSTAIRNYLRQGDLARARALLGRVFSVQGPVRPGQRIAHTLGFSTANLMPPANFGLARGVYATITRVQGVDYVSATNVGVRPSVSAIPMLTIESHCLDQELDLAGCELEIFFIERIRDELKFGSLSELQVQVHKDMAQIREMHRLDPAQFAL